MSDEEDFRILQELSDFDTDEDDQPSRSSTKSYRDRINYLEVYDSKEFHYRFRLDKSAFEDLLCQIYPFIQVTSQKNHGISPLHQLLLTLRFYALGTMLVSVADYVGVSKSSASRIVKTISAAIARLYHHYVYIHSNTQEGFYNIARFPCVLGAIDGTHILMQSPNSDIGEEFRNRKSLFSLNVQAVCDSQLRFMNVVGRWPGSAHDATIFNSSELKAECENGKYGDRWLLGDSGYPCKKYLLTPILNPQNDNEVRYNYAHIRTRNTIERCFGVWKRRFPILSLKMRLAMNTTQAVIIATAVLHNICRQRNLEEMAPEIDIPDYGITFSTQDFPDTSVNDMNARSLVVDRCFSN